MHGWRLLLVILTLTALSMAPASTLASTNTEADDGCESRLYVYSGAREVVGFGYNPGAWCATGSRASGDGAHGIAAQAVDLAYAICDPHMGTQICAAATDPLRTPLPPLDAPMVPIVDTRFILPSEAVSIGFIEEVPGAPATLSAQVDGLGHDALMVDLVDRDGEGRAYYSELLAVEGSGELRVLLTLPDGDVRVTVYRTIDVA